MKTRAMKYLAKIIGNYLNVYIRARIEKQQCLNVFSLIRRQTFAYAKIIEKEKL